MTVEHLKPIADNFRDMGRFCQVGELMARGQLPQEIQQVVRMGRMTALKKTTGVRGIVAGDIIRFGFRWRRLQRPFSTPCGV